MSRFFARARRSAAGWLAPLLEAQAADADVEVGELIDFADAAVRGAHALIAVDNPPPARGYAILTPEGADGPAVLARAHVLADLSPEASRAMFSTMIVQARRLRPGAAGVHVLLDTATTAAHVREAVKRDGALYGVYLLGEEPVIEVEASAEVTEGDEPAEIEGVEPGDDGIPVLEPADAPETVEEPADAADGEEEPGFECFECGKMFATPQGLASHSRVHSD